MDPLPSESVVRVTDPAMDEGLKATFTVSELAAAIMEYPDQAWVKDGVQARVLVPGKQWEKGRLKLELSFEADSRKTLDPEAS